MSKKLAVLGASLAFAASLTLPLSVSASALTSTQIDAIVSLLKSFGADSTTVSNVQTALGGSSTPSQSCSDFADVTYGDFDNDQGGRVSQLQTFLGISPHTFGFGTYGRKTRATWNNQCGETHPTPKPILCPDGQHSNGNGFQCVPDSTSSQAPSISGLDAPVSLATGQSGTWTVHASVANQTNTYLKYSVIWGDEVAYPMSYAASSASAPIQTSATFTHTYQTAGTYTPTFIVANGSGSAKTSATVIVGGGYATQSCTITSSKSSANAGDQFTLSWTTNGITNPVMYQLVKGGGYVSVASSGTMSWTAESNKGTSAYQDVFQIGTGGLGLGSTFTSLCSVSVSLNPSAVATIDQSSLTQTSNTVSISGSATNTSSVLLGIEDYNYAGSRDYTAVSGDAVLQKTNYYLSSAPISVVNGRWVSPQMYEANGTYLVLVYDWTSKTLLTTGTLTVAGTIAAQTTISASAYPAVVKNSGGTTQLKWDITNAPSGAALEIGISGTALNATGDATLPYRNLVSPYLLDGTTRTVNLATFGQTSMPSHGTINFSPSFFSGYLPISGPVNFTVLDSNSNVLARTSAPLQITGN